MRWVGTNRGLSRFRERHFHSSTISVRPRTGPVDCRAHLRADARLGLCGRLERAGLPQGHVPTALLFFSLGVETGHFLFIGVVLSLVALVRRVRLPWPRWIELVTPYAIGSVAMFWVIQRVTMF